MANGFPIWLIEKGHFHADSLALANVKQVWFAHFQPFIFAVQVVMYWGGKMGVLH